MPELPEVETIRRTLAPLLVGRGVRAARVTAPDVMGRPEGDPAALGKALVGLRCTGLGRRGKYLLLWWAAGDPGAAGGPPGRGAGEPARAGRAGDGGAPGRDGGGGPGREGHGPDRTGGAPGRGGDGDPPGAPGAVLVVHLRMTGRLQVVPAHAPVEPHTHAALALDDGCELRFRDVRRFGRLYLYRPDELAPRCGAGGPSGPAAGGAAGGRDGAARTPAPAVPPGLFALGPEPWDPALPALLREAFRGRRAPVKSLLLNQSLVAGVGNIYADEALHGAGIHPATPAGRLGPREVEALVGALRQVLERALALGGTTLRDYVDGRGLPGGMRPHLRVYGRAGQPCRRCGTPVRRERVAGRSAYYCPRCQPVP